MIRARPASLFLSQRGQRLADRRPRRQRLLGGLQRRRLLCDLRRIGNGGFQMLPKRIGGLRNRGLLGWLDRRRCQVDLSRTGLDRCRRRFARLRLDRFHGRRLGFGFGLRRRRLVDDRLRQHIRWKSEIANPRGKMQAFIAVQTHPVVGADLPTPGHRADLPGSKRPPHHAISAHHVIRHIRRLPTRPLEARTELGVCIGRFRGTADRRDVPS